MVRYKRYKRARVSSAQVPSATIAEMIARLTIRTLPGDGRVVYFPVNRSLVQDLAKQAGVSPRGFQIRDIQYLTHRKAKSINDIMIVDYMTSLKYYTTEAPSLPSLPRLIWDDIGRVIRNVLR